MCDTMHCLHIYILMHAEIQYMHKFTNTNYNQGIYIYYKTLYTLSVHNNNNNDTFLWSLIYLHQRPGNGSQVVIVTTVSELKVMCTAQK